MIKEFKKNVGYICPECSTITVKEINIFNLSEGNAASFVCSDSNCDYAPVSVTPKKDSYTVTVHCPICDDEHYYTIKKITFWNSDFFVFFCPETSFGVFFIGNEDKIRAEIDTQEKMLSELEEEFNIGNELSLIFEAVDHINKLAKNQSISCSCSGHNIAIEIDNDFITLFCRDCGKEKKIPTSPESLEQLLNASSILLD